MTATLLVGDVYERQTELIALGAKFDLVITSPPFLAQRSYLPDDHPDKAKEIGSEATPADYLDVLLALTAQWRLLLAPHGSIAVELGDTYAGSGGAGGDYNPGGLRDGQNNYTGTNYRQRNVGKLARVDDGGGHAIPTLPGGYAGGGPGWPLNKSLCGIPSLYAWSLAYGRNLLTGQESPAGRWRIRNLKPWIRTNPPVGALGDKERPATSYITVACVARDRWFDLDAVRTAPVPANRRTAKGVDQIDRVGKSADRGGNWASLPEQAESGGAPPLDWWHQVDAVIDDELQQRAGKSSGSGPGGARHHNEADGNDNGAHPTIGGGSVGARGHHIRRRLEKAGILPPHPDALDISPRGYSGAHYAVWPPELVRQLVDEMCPRRVCTVCGQPSRRIVEKSDDYAKRGRSWADLDTGRGKAARRERNNHSGQPPGDHITAAEYITTGWSDCGCRCADCHTASIHYGQDPALDPMPCPHHWRLGRILDPFSGSGTTLAVATGMGRDAVGVDLDPRNAHLTEARCGMFLTVDWGHLQPTDELPPDEIVQAVGGDLL